MDDIRAIEEGKAAWSRLHARDRARWQDWLAVARAISIGRAASLAAAGTNKPFGKKYTRAMKAWLVANGLDGVGQQVRWRCLQILDHLPDVEMFLATLDDNTRDRLNHPDSVWMHFQRRGEPAHVSAPRRAAERHPRPPVESTGPARSGKAVFWNADHIRRGAEALRMCRSTDCFTITRAVLEAAVRCEADLMQLLDRPNPPRHGPAEAAAPTELHA